MRSDALRLADMQEAIALIRSWTSSYSAEFLGDLKTTDAVAFQIWKLCQAAAGVSPAVRRAHRNIPWSGLVGRRDRMVREGFRVDPDSLRTYVTRELLPLERSLQRVSAAPDR
jgi:uncharacterized protein with HEPN domain